MGGDSADQEASGGPAFDVVTIFKIPEPDSSKSEASNGPPGRPHSSPSYLLRIRSPAVIHALQSVVQYYPGQDLTSYPILVSWPYPILVHHYDELREFSEECARKDPSDRCIREECAREHIGLLLDFLDKTVMEKVNEEKERNKRRFRTFEWAWVVWKPGTTVLWTSRDEAGIWRGSVVHSVTGGTFQSPPSAWEIRRWQLTYDGTYLGRHLSVIEDVKYDGESDMTDGERIVTDGDFMDEIVTKNIKYGETYWKLLQKQCKCYKGRTTDFPYNEVSETQTCNLIFAHVTTG